jgi:hypothetical protein
MTHAVTAPGTSRSVGVMLMVALVLMAALVGLPFAVLPSPLLAWFAVPGFLAGAAGVVTRSVPLVTASASLALIEYAVALTIAAAPVDVVTATGFGAALFVLLELVHLAGRVHGAHIGRSVVAIHVRHWLVIVALGAAAAVALPAGAAALRLAVSGVPLALVVIASALGALLAAAGVLARVHETSGSRQARGVPPSAASPSGQPRVPATERSTESSAGQGGRG